MAVLEDHKGMLYEVLGKKDEIRKQLDKIFSTGTSTVQSAYSGLQINEVSKDIWMSWFRMFQDDPAVLVWLLATDVNIRKRLSKRDPYV